MKTGRVGKDPLSHGPGLITSGAEPAQLAVRECDDYLGQQMIVGQSSNTCWLPHIEQAVWAVLICIVSADCGSATTPSPTPSPAPTDFAWSVTGTVTDREGRPINVATVQLFLDPRSSAATGSTNAQGRFNLSTTAGAGSGQLRVSVNGFITQIVPFTCVPPVPGARLCGDQNSMTVNVTLTRILSAVVTSPTSLHVGETMPVTRVIQLDDGRTITDNGFSPALSSDDIVYTNNPAIVALVSGTGPVLMVKGVSDGQTNIVTRLAFVYGMTPVRASAAD